MFTFLTKLPTLVLFLAAFGVSFSAALPARSKPLEPTVDAYARRLELLKGPLGPKGSSESQKYRQRRRRRRRPGGVRVVGDFTEDIPEVGRSK
ncbi:uncharacterized protein EI90DRAFT_3049434 [Cantharellus anzutake]|uniref:uncharacterized protein n=1 Tax=Cantharellus anzutake TaxID=1750568 RepID=UPI001903F472|nr:uncharacterized protein EI90DRAFT_3082630 [Cantharellus anzutake]XP_038918097.1 uncharacterized protein EI90DRAFT_3049434 [Cantharellus anzutake]KAF8318908.1 hypothetical protein EI90DRAFT_3082630 [Cantharellus anzutake]KAF8334591.1 hypothetical protein EI90DRAFT_3049434 [Cantharellus anzutake]